MTDNTLLGLTRRQALSSILALPALKFIPLSIITNARAVAEPYLAPDNYNVVLDEIYFDAGDKLGRAGNNIYTECGVARLVNNELDPIIQIRLKWATAYRWKADPGSQIICTDKYPTIVYTKGIQGVIKHDRAVQAVVISDSRGRVIISSEK